MNVRLVDCELCGSEVAVRDVYRATLMKKASGFVALLWVCSSCGANGRTAAPITDWDRLIERQEAYDDSAGMKYKMFELDMQYVNDVGDLLTLWASYPGPVVIEPRPGMGCGCDSCRGRLYG